jgi:hypothetical protein
MQLTAHELTAASSIVAALAIIGGYLGVRSANRGALNIAREERSARRQSELESLKRAAYSEFLVALSTLADDQMAFDTADKYDKKEAPELWRQSVRSAQVANNRLAQLALIAPPSIHRMAEDAFKHALKASEAEISALASEEEHLITAMRADLET